MDLLTEKNKKMYLDYFNIDNKDFIKRRIKIALIMLVIMLVIHMTSGNDLTLLLIPIMAFVGYKLPYVELLNQVSQEDIIKEYMFPNFLRYFISLLDTQGNVYRTLKSTIHYVEDPIKTELENLVKKLDEDNVKNYAAFREFADFIGSSEAHMIMGVIYQFNEEGIKKDEIDELENTIKQLQENKINELIEVKSSKLDKHANPVLVYTLGYIMIFTGLVFMSYFKMIEYL